MRSRALPDVSPGENRVSVEPGQIPEARTPYWQTSSARDSVKPTTPNFDAQYIARFAEPTFPAMEAILMIWPRLRSIIDGSTYRQEKKIPRKFVSIRVSKSSSLKLTTGPKIPDPAAFTRMSTGPT